MHLYPEGMSCVRRAIPRGDLEIEARARGLVLSEFRLDKFSICEAVIRDQDIDRVQATSTP